MEPPYTVTTTTRVLHFIGEITYRTVDEFIERIKRYEQTKQLRIVMSTHGGSTTAAICLHDFLRCQPLPVIMIASGAVNSAGLYPFLAGDLRFAFPSAGFLFHPGSLDLSGTHSVSDLSESIHSMESEDERCASLVTSRTSMTAADLATVTRERRTLTIQQAISFGIIHGLADYPEKDKTTFIPGAICDAQ